MNLTHRETQNAAPAAANAAIGAGGSNGAAAAETDSTGGSTPVDAPGAQVPPGRRDRVFDADQFAALLRVLGEWGDKLRIPRRRPGVIDELSFADVVAYFTEQHPGDPRISAGALICQPHPKGRLVFQVFLDERDRPCLDPSGAPYGRRLVAGSFDDELTRRLRGDQMLIFR